MQLHQLAHVQLREIADLRALRFAVRDLVDAARRAVNASGLVTFPCVAPVEHEHAAVRPVAEVEAAKPRIAEEETIPAVRADIPGAGALENLLVRPKAVHVQCKEMTAIFGRPVVTEINHRSNVRVPPAVSVGGAGSRCRPVFRGVEMPMISVHVNQLIGARIWINRVWPDKVRAGNQVPEVSVDGVDVKRLAMFVPIVAPRIGRAGGERLEDFPSRMITPHPAANRHPRTIRRAGHTDFAGSRRAATSVEPTVRPPAQAIGEVVIVGRGHFESVEHYFGRAVGNTVAVFVWNEDQLLRAQRPHAAESDLDACKHLHFVRENIPRVETAVAIVVLEDQDAVAQVQIELFPVLGVGVVLCYPKPASRIPSHRDGILHIRFGGENGRLETGWEFQRRE